jgi:DNA mismatch repair protein MutS
MAGLPGIVIERAREILHNLESHSLDITNSNGTLTEGAKKQQSARKAIKQIEKQDPLPQLSLFGGQIDPRLENVKERLEASDPNRMSPIESLLLVAELKRLLSE